MTEDKNSETRKTQQERRDEAEKQLLQAASELIAEEGIARTSLAKIGERAGYSRGLVNYHFKTKDALLERLVECSQQAFDRLQATQIAENALATMIWRLEAYLTDSFSSKEYSPTLIVMWGAALPKQSDRGPIFRAEARVRNDIKELIIKGQQDGSIRNDVDVKTASFMLLGMVRGIFAELVLTPEEAEVDRVFSEVRSCVTAYLQA